MPGTSSPQGACPLSLRIGSIHVCVSLSLPPFFILSFSPFPLLRYVKYSKCSELEEELKNVTNNLKSLEAQAEKVGAGPWKQQAWGLGPALPSVNNRGSAFLV